MANVIGGGNAAIQALLYGDVHPGTQRYFESQRGEGLGSLTQTARTFVKEAVDRFGFMATERTRRLIANVRRAADWAWHGDYIRPLRTVDEMQLAAPTMIRYIMAEPTIRQMYHRQEIAGYDDHYTDTQPGVVGEEHRDYRRVMQGIVVVNEDATPDSEDQFHSDEWIDDLLEDERELEFGEQLDVLETWANVKRVMRDRLRDPTSLYNASLS